MKGNKDSSLQYLAGLLDSIGTVRIENPKKGERPSLYVWITSKHFGLMELLQAFGAYVSQRQDGQYRAKWRDLKAYNLLKTISPLLHIKKEQVRVGLEFWEHRKQEADPEGDVIYRLRLKLTKRADESE